MSFFSNMFGRGGRRPERDPDLNASPDEPLRYVEAPQGEKPIELQGLSVRALVNGLYAETTQTLRFYNPNRRDLEGELTFPLPDGAVVCGYAIDVGGRMVDGVIVPKKEARRILEAEVRKGVDPGLVEKVQGNVYRARIYPIPARGTRTVRITYVSELNAQGDDAGYHLPLARANAAAEVELRIEVAQSPVTPELSGGVGNVTLSRMQSRWVAEATLPRGALSEDLQIRLPRLPEAFTSIERHGDEGAFFCLSARLREPDAPLEATWSPRRVGVAWDASGSRGDISRDLALLRALLERWRSVTVDLVVVRDVALPPETFTIERGDGQALLDRLAALPADGGTDLTALDLSRAPHEHADAWLLFSDGMGTTRSGLPRLGGARVHCVTSQAASNTGLLGHVARQTGGCHVNLLRTRPDEAAAQLCEHRVALHLSDSTGCSDVHTRVSQGRLLVLGRLLAPRASVTLVDPLGARATLDIQADDRAPGGGVLARAWAALEVEALELEGDAQKDKILALGRRFHLVTPGTSLLVLETLEQYLEHDIEPPSTWPEMHRAWHDRRDRDARTRRDAEDKHVDEVLALWRKRVEWWETDFRGQWRAPDPAPRAGGRGVARDSTTRYSLDAMPSSAPRMAAARPAPRRAMEESFDEDCDDSFGDSPAPAAPMAAAAPAAPPMMDAMLAEEAPRGAVRRRRGPPEPKLEAGPASARASVAIQPWSPDTPYLTAMRRARDPYAAYLDAREKHRMSPAFYLDCGDLLLKADRRAEGLRVLSNLLELGLDDAALMRMYAWRLGQAGEVDVAVEILERVLAARDDEPQSHRDLALMLGQRWQQTRDPADATRAMELLYTVILKRWDRFPEIELIALMELNRLIHLAREAGLEPPARIDRRLVRLLDLDIRISMSWDADLTDVDLHVYEPTGEHAYYGHNRTRIGGLVSRDFTQGYGPEEYVLRRAYPGAYTIKAHYYGSSQQRLTGACTVIVKVFTNYGRADEQLQMLTLRLERPRDQVKVGEITIDASAVAARPEPLWRETFGQLSRGMTLDQITAALGQPASIEGGDQMILVYRPRDGVTVKIRVGPRLLSVVAELDGATLELV